MIRDEATRLRELHEKDKFTNKLSEQQETKKDFTMNDYIRAFTTNSNSRSREVAKKIFGHGR